MLWKASTRPAQGHYVDSRKEPIWFPYMCRRRNNTSEKKTAIILLKRERKVKEFSLPRKVWCNTNLRLEEATNGSLIIFWPSDLIVLSSFIRFLSKRFASCADVQFAWIFSLEQWNSKTMELRTITHQWQQHKNSLCSYISLKANHLMFALCEIIITSRAADGSYSQVMAVWNVAVMWVLEINLENLPSQMLFGLICSWL